jgi:hypothetical protein
MRITREREDCSVTRNRREGTEMWTTIVRRTQLSRSCFSALKQDVRSGNSGSPVVAMMQATESGHHDNFAPGLRIIHRYTAGRCFLGQREMRPILMVVANVLIHKPF